MNIDANEVKHAANGKWPSILAHCAGLDERQLSNRHQPCPACGGTDRYRFDDKAGDGEHFCNGCGAGDGFALLQKVTGWDFNTAKTRVAEYLGVVLRRADSEYVQPSPEMLAKRKAEQEAAEIERQRKEEEKHAKAAQVALEIWRAAGKATNETPYLKSKGVEAVDTLREIDAETASRIAGYTIKSNDEPLSGCVLIAPVKVAGNEGDSLSSLEFIDEYGRKAALYGGKKKGGFWATERLPQGEGEGCTIAIGEGVSTSLTTRQAAECIGVAAFSCNNLGAVARAFRQRYPKARIILLADLGNGQEDAEKAARDNACFLAVPAFTPEQEERNTQQHGKGPTDWNDVHQLAGLEAVREQVTAAMVETASQPPDENNQAEPTESEASQQHETPDTPPPADDDRYIKYLAGLSPLHYERVRAAAAKQMGIKRASVLDKLVQAARKEMGGSQDDKAAGTMVLFDDVEPWPTPVDGAALLEDAYQLLARYVIADRETLRAAALWAAMTWFTNYASVLPLAVITAPEKGCGKSTLLTALAKLACRPLYASNITPAALFRAVEKWQPTLMIDEADAFAKDNEELRGVLNAGHTRDTAVVIRVVDVGGEMEPRAFSVWGAKALAGIGHLPGTIMSRAVVLTMRRKLPDESAENLRHCDRAAFYDVKRRLARWADDVGDEFADMRPTMDGLHNRDADNWEPLLALADLAAGHWPQLARQAAVRLTAGEEDAPSLNEELLTDIRTVFERLNVDRISSADLLDELCKDDESAWATYNRGKPVSARQLSKRLGEFGVKPEVIRIGASTPRGYKLEWFADVFARYLPSVGAVSATLSHPAPGVGTGHFAIRNTKHVVADKKALEPASLLGCYNVADTTPLSGDENEKRGKSNFVEVEI